MYQKIVMRIPIPKQGAGDTAQLSTRNNGIEVFAERYVTERM
jgi:hypothetical protein